MINVIVELSKYIILTLMIIYTFHCFYTVRQSDEEERNELLRQQLLLIFFIDFTAFLIIYLKTFNFQVVLCGDAVVFCCNPDFVSSLLQKSIHTSSEQYVYAFKRRFYHAVQTGYLCSTETASYRSRSQWHCTDHSRNDPQDAFLT